MPSDKYFIVRPCYTLTINEAQRKLIQQALSVVSSNPVFDADDTEELNKLADSFKPMQENPEYGLQPAPAINSLCV